MKNNLKGIINLTLVIIFAITLNLSAAAQINIPKIPTSESKTNIPAAVIGGRYMAWTRVPVNAASFTNCLGVAEMTMNGFRDVRTSASEVSGKHGTTYAAITCLRAASGDMAYIAVIGGDQRKTNQVRDTLRGRFANNGMALPAASTVENNNYFYWGTTPVKAGTHKGCQQIVEYATRSLFQNVTRREEEITATSGEIYASVACEKTSTQYAAVVMVVGATDRRTSLARENLRKKIAATVNIDDGPALNPQP
jgi:hypothetical protein